MKTVIDIVMRAKNFSVASQNLERIHSCIMTRLEAFLLLLSEVPEV